MLWPKEKYDVVFKQIKKQAVKDGSILILVAPDVDALCACHILTSLLKAEMISFTVLPVSGYIDLMNVNEEKLRDNEDIKSIILVNCGAIVNLQKIFDLQQEQKCYVIDSHRPIHLTNIYESEGKIIVLDDGTQALEDYPSDGSDIENDGKSDVEEDNKSGDDESDSESEAEAELDSEKMVGNHEDDHLDEDDESFEKRSDFAENESQVGEKRKRIKDFENDESATDEPEGDDAQDDLGTSTHDPVTSNVTADNVRQSNRQRRMALNNYYSGSYHGSSSAALAYELASQLNGATNDRLWLAIVGLTKQFVAQEIDSDYYNLWVQKFQNDVLPMNHHSEGIFASDGTPIPAVEDGKIGFEEEYRLMLYRHWSLYDSMYFSNYVASKLGIWRTDGKDELEVFLARMGFSLVQCRQKFTFMSMELKQKLEDKIREIAPEFGMEEIFYGSFHRQIEYKYQLCAADVVHSVAALLEAPLSFVRKAMGQDGIGEESNLDEEDTHWKDSFHLAYNAIPCKNEGSRKLMEMGINLSMSLQKSVVDLGLSIIERKLIIRVKHFRYACLRLAEDDQKVFSQPQTLSKLALFLVDVHREAGKWTGDNAFPFVLICRHESQDCFLVVGVTCPQRSGEILRNTLGTAFKLAANELKANHRHDGFETTVIEIDVDDIQEFIEQLHNVMDA